MESQPLNSGIFLKTLNHLLYLGLKEENLSSGVCEQQWCRPACAPAQPDQRLLCLPFGKYNI